MYATKPLSIFKAFPETAFQPPPEGPSSGYLVHKDEVSDGGDSACCWGLCEGTRVRDLPFPQNRILTVRYSEQQGENSSHYSAVVFFIPVLDKPLSSNHYYVVVGKGKDKGKIYTCSKEEDMSTWCFCQCINDVKPSPFDHRNIYQQMEIVPKKGKFTAKSAAPDGFAPWLFRKKYWRVYAAQPENYSLSDALGLDIALRSRPLKLDFPITVEDTPKSAIGKWYCPFFFVKENRSFKEQMSNAMFYEISLEQIWEQIYAKGNFYGDCANVVEVNTSVQSKRVTVNGEVAVEAADVDGFVWFANVVSRRESFGLSLAVWNRMRLEQSREGWVDAGEERVERVEEFGGGLNGWKRFGCYVFVERYVFKRMDGILAFTFDFLHNRKVRTKWE
ncbi:uncharacterized protein LOC109706624 [Ananas comosus]|uniref:Uncharacterized protein LOC109706624 n=1 Tax=Ananas comosus TaxID=4615 RepID=A0A6P5EPD8_ANACO|nr:uncharacterized protein LOC109706624 [Ananas comosus]